jgi:predicted MFS family arabinose efflux permease
VGAGAIVEALGWRALFWVGAAVVAAALGLVAAAVPRSSVRSDVGLDLIGGALLTGGLAAILVALTEQARRLTYWRRSQRGRRPPRPAYSRTSPR